MEKEIQVRKAKALSIMGQLNAVWKDTESSCKLKVQMYEARKRGH